jgi:hypothetical protein
MKKILFGMFIGIMLTLSLGFTYYKATQLPEKEFIVKGTQNQWKEILYQLDTAQKVAGNGDIPTKVTMRVYTFIPEIQRFIINQIDPQMKTENSKSIDTTAAKPKQ